MTEFPDVIERPQTHVWATLVPMRSPEFKVHQSEGFANSALGQRGLYESYAKYELVNGSWVKRFEYHPPTHCSQCGNAFANKVEITRKTRFYSGLRWNAPLICRECSQEDNREHYRILKEKSERETLAKLKAKYDN